jgi:hypothetical protein
MGPSATVFGDINESLTDSGVRASYFRFLPGRLREELTWPDSLLLLTMRRQAKAPRLTRIKMG